MTHEAFNHFHAETADKLWAYLLRICDNREIAKDILQESYLRFLQKPPADTEFAQMKSYLYTIATRFNLDRIKTVNRRREKLRAAFENNGLSGRNEMPIEYIQVDMEIIFARLKSRERALLWLAYVEEQPHRAIANILGMREKSVKVLLFRARRKLAKILKKHKLDEGVLFE